MNYTTYQAVSGSGQKGINDLANTIIGKPNTFYPYDISKTCIPEIDIAYENGYTKEEMKMVWETKKMLHNDNILVSATCVRVPVLNSHAVSVSCELDKNFTIEEVEEVLSRFENIVVVNDLEKHIYPTSIIANGNDKVYVGRIRRDLANENGLLFYCVADNIRKGAASNAVQIASRLALIDEI